MVVLVPRKKRDVVRALKKKGFTEVKDKDNNYYFLYINGKKTIVNTKISHGSHSDISDGLLGEMRRQMCLPVREFNDYMNCTFSKEDYINYLASIGKIELPDVSKEKVAV